MSTSVFESRPCSRCGGSGHHSFCPSYGTTCFGCHGRGWQLTKRGAAANAFFAASLCRPAGEIKVGDVIRIEGIPGISRDEWGTVESIGYDGISSVNGVPSFGVHTDKGGIYGSPESAIRYRHTNEEKAAKRVAALAYQETLTKTGAVRKRTQKG